MDDNSDLFSGFQDTPKTPGTASARPDRPAAPKAKPAPAQEKSAEYDASSIEILEGLEPVRRRPGMYIGGTDDKAMHHLFAEVIDNSMDEAVAGHATFIEVALSADGYLTVTDNGRGIPVGPHPKHKDKSALEVVMTTLHAGGKFDSKVYETSGGLHGVGVSVVNALSDDLEVEVAVGRRLYRQRYSRGHPMTALEDLGEVQNRRGTRTRFHPDPDIFGKSAKFEPARLYKMARSKAYLFGGVEIRWQCAPELLGEKDPTPPRAVFHFPGGLKDYLEASLGSEQRDHRQYLCRQERPPGRTRLGRMGDHLAWRRRLHQQLLQHHSDRRRRHARGRPAHRADPRPEILRRTGRQQARCRSHNRRRDDLGGSHAVGLRARTGIRRSDQGQAGDHGSPAHRRNPRCATHSTTGSPRRRRRPTPSSTGSSTAPTSA